jgi:hypothetical protein
MPASAPHRNGRILAAARLLQRHPGGALALSGLEDGVFALFTQWMHLI